MKYQEMRICLWFENEAEQAAKFYRSIFPDSEIEQITRFGKDGFEFHGKAEGTVMTVDFRINKMSFTALNGGTKFKFNEAVSIIIHCDMQEEIDHYWMHLSEDGEEGPCGWLKDKFGLSWQITPSILPKYLSDKDPAKKSRVEQVVFKMKKIDIKMLNDALEGK